MPPRDQRDHAGTAGPSTSLGTGARSRGAGLQPGGAGTAYSILLIVGSLLVGTAVAGESGVLAMLQARRQYDELARSVADLREENARLKEEIIRLRSDPTAIEEIARRELGLVRPGEKVFIIRDVPRKK